MIRKQVFLVFISIVYTAFMTSCSSSPKEMPTISVGICSSISSALYNIAEKKSYFSDAGVNVDLRYFQSGPATVSEGLLKGEVDVANTASTSLVFLAHKHSNIKIIATASSSFNSAKVIAKKKFVKNVSDLKNARIAVMKSTGTHVFLDTLFVKHGINEDYVSVVFPKRKHLQSMLIKEEVHAAVMADPLLSRTKEILRDDYIIISEPHLYQKFYCVVSKEKTISENKEALKRMFLALIRAEKFVRENEEEAVKIIAYEKRISEDVVLSSLPENDFSLQLMQSLINTLESDYAWAKNHAYIDKEQADFNFLNMISHDIFKAVLPNEITIIK